MLVLNSLEFFFYFFFFYSLWLYVNLVHLVLVCVFKHLFIWDFFLSPHCSLSFPPKRYAAMENSYAPSNVMLLILATRTGKGCRQNLVLISFFLFCCDNEITSYVSCCIPHTDISYSIVSISQFNHRWVLIWLQMVTLAPSPYFTTLISMLLSFIKWAPVVLHSSSFFKFVAPLFSQPSWFHIF